MLLTWGCAGWLSGLWLCWLTESAQGTGHAAAWPADFLARGLTALVGWVVRRFTDRRRVMGVPEFRMGACFPESIRVSE